MVKILDYTAKHPAAGIDYKVAYDLVNGMALGESKTIKPENNKAFRKYIYDLSYKQNKEFATRKRQPNSLQITRLS